MTEQVRDGKSPDTAFLVTDSSGEFTSSIANFIEQRYGGKDGDFFILSETTMVSKDHDNKKFKVLYVEDCNNVKHTVYFEIG